MATQEFDSGLFTFLLLPIIIFEAAYHSSNFYVFLMLKPILMFAFFGTLIPFFIMWPTINAAGYLPSAESAMFAGLIAAVDPVATLSVFSEIKAEPKLQALISGEAILNDAIAIALYRAAKEFEGENAGKSIGENVGLFILLVVVSVLVGFLVALACAVVLKYGHLWSTQFHRSEVIVFVGFSYASFLVSEMCGQSGIIASLVAGFAMREYAKPNMSKASKKVSSEVIETFALAAETFVFVQVGINMPLRGAEEFNFGFVCLAIVMCIACRAFSTALLANSYNLFKKTTSRTYISRGFQVVTFWAGLRGAIAFAVAYDFPDDNGNRSLVISTTCFVILFTVFVQGSTTRFVMKKMNIETGCDGETTSEKRKDIKKSAFRTRLTDTSNYISRLVIRQYVRDSLTRFNSSDLERDTNGQISGAAIRDESDAKPLCEATTIDDEEELGDGIDDDDAPQSPTRIHAAKLLAMASESSTKQSDVEITI